MSARTAPRPRGTPSRPMPAGWPAAILLALLLLRLELAADIIFHGGNIVNRQSPSLDMDVDNNGVNDLALDANLNLGLLTLSPSANLDVAGNTLVTDCLLLGQAAPAPAATAGLAALYMLSSNLQFADGSTTMLFAGTPLWTAAAGNLSFVTGRVGIGTTSPSANLQVAGNVVCTDLLPVTSGQYTLGAADLAWSAVYARDLHLLSDRRLKEDITPAGYGLEALRRLQPVRYRYAGADAERLGFIAQDVEQVVPEAVSVGGDAAATRSIRHGSLLPVLAGACREGQERLAAEKAALRRELEALRQETALLEARLARQRARLER